MQENLAIHDVVVQHLIVNLNNLDNQTIPDGNNQNISSNDREVSEIDIGDVKSDHADVDDHNMDVDGVT